MQKRPMQHAVISTFENWLIQDSTEALVQQKDREYKPEDPFIVIHTSGSSGLPKPVTIYLGGLATVDSHRQLPPSHGFKAQVVSELKEQPERYFVALPPFHVSHFY